MEVRKCGATSKKTPLLRDESLAEANHAVLVFTLLSQAAGIEPPTAKADEVKTETYSLRSEWPVPTYLACKCSIWLQQQHGRQSK